MYSNRNGNGIRKDCRVDESDEGRKTPLQISLDSFSKKLAILIMAICALVFCLGISPEDAGH